MANEQFVICETQYGPVKGIQALSTLGRDYFSFRGIPYMKAPLGRLRFRDAQPPEIWGSEPFDATNEGPCYVMTNFMTGVNDGQENAGVINVYTKSLDHYKKMPVLGSYPIKNILKILKF